MTAAAPNRTPSRARCTKPLSGRSSRGPTDADLRLRAKRLLENEIEFIPNKAFLAPDAEAAIPALGEPHGLDREHPGDALRDLPGHLARMCAARMLSAEEETALFRRMNFVKHRANVLRASLDPDRPHAEAIATAERLLAEARAIRNRIVQANMRLAIAAVKQFVSPQHSFDDLLSEGTSTLILAVEKFDYDRGFRFSTYAYRAISRNCYRKITDWRKEQWRREGVVDSLSCELEDHGGASRMDERTWETLRGLLRGLIGQLDRREQFILRSRHALGAHRRVRTFQELADRLGVSKERVRQLEQRAIAKLSDLARGMDVERLLAAPSE